MVDIGTLELFQKGKHICQFKSHAGIKSTFRTRLQIFCIFSQVSPGVLETCFMAIKWVKYDSFYTSAGKICRTAAPNTLAASQHRDKDFSFTEAGTSARKASAIMLSKKQGKKAEKERIFFAPTGPALSQSMIVH